MAVKRYRPHTPSRRFAIGYDFSDITKTTPEKSLVKFIGKTWGRNNQGRTTSRFIGGGHKRMYRDIDFKGYDKENIPAKVASIEYDPYRTSRIALLNFADWEKRYVIAWKNIEVGTKVMNGKDSPIQAWNRKQLKDIPEWINIFLLEVTPFSEWKLVKSAGSYATISGKDEATGYVFVKLSSWEVRKFNENCRATIWEIWNEQHKNVILGKAGRMRWLWRKPRMLGKSMNPCDHPHGGWEGHTEIGLKKWPKAFNGRVVAPWIKTRKKKKWSTKFIVSKRTKN